MRVFIITLFIIALSSFSFADETASQRIASVSLCADPLLIKLVKPMRINSLYYLSANPQFSIVAKEAANYQLNHGLAEEIVPRNPDLIVAGEFTNAEIKNLLKQLGLRVEILPLPRTLEDISSHIRLFGKITSSEIEAEKMAQEIEQKLAQVKSMQNTLKPIRAFWYSSNGVVVSSGTMENELMERTGFHNLALDKSISGFAQIDLEELILAKPDALIMDSSDVQAFSLASEYIQHPALRKNNIRIIALPTTLSCIAPVVVDAIQNLLDQRNQF